ncbi:MAG: MarR family winged helix-turn-helix transcriptional regulator [Xenococcaceae cyanobacterium]
MKYFVDSQAVNNLAELAERYPELDIASVETCLAFLQTTADVYRALEVHFARYHLSMGKFTLLMQLLQAGRGGLAPSQCADRSGVTRATITGLLDGLEKDGLVERKPYLNDKRRLYVQLTEKGRHLLNKILPDHFCRTTNLMANLSETDKQTLIGLLAKLRAGVPAMLEK